MQIKINKKILYDTIVNLEDECEKQYGTGFCLFGQIMVKGGNLVLNLGVFNQNEFDTLDNLIKNRNAKEWEKTIKIKGITHGHN